MSRLTRRFVTLHLYLLLVAMLGSTTLLVIAYLLAIRSMRRYARAELIRARPASRTGAQDALDMSTLAPRYWSASRRTI